MSLHPSPSFTLTEIAPAVVAPIRPCASQQVGIMHAGDAYRLVAVRPIPSGTRLFQIDGVETSYPTRHSLQIDADLHINSPIGISQADVFDQYFWRFLNHSCTPNATIRDLTLVTLSDIAQWSDITFDYDTTEYEIACPFACHCGSAFCRQTIRGFKFLLHAERERVRSQLAPYLLRRFDQDDTVDVAPQRRGNNS